MLVVPILGIIRNADIERINFIHILEYEMLFLHSDRLKTFDAHSTSFFPKTYF